MVDTFTYGGCKKNIDYVVNNVTYKLVLESYHEDIAFLYCVDDSKSKIDMPHNITVVNTSEHKTLRRPWDNIHFMLVRLYSYHVLIDGVVALKLNDKYEQTLEIM
jgi:hypothetical protein